jgi:hypothetical protein
MKRRVYLAAGHGAGDPGSSGQGTTEAAEAIQIVNRAATKLRADGQVEVIVVPHELGLVGAINWVNAHSNNLDDGLAIEVHKNATVNASGVEVWYWGNDAGSRSLAEKALAGIMSVPGMPRSRGVKGDNTNRHGSLGWIRQTTPWALLYEMGFISQGGDPVDDAADDRYAEGILMSVLRVHGLSKRTIPVPTPAPKPVQIAFRVYGADGKQIGAYQNEANAWNKYAAEGGTKIVNSAGQDITSAMVLKYRPPAPPADPSPSHPVYDPSKDKDQDARLSAIEAALAALKAVVDGIVSFLTSFNKKP